ncbi:MAG TPA: trehalose-phosphatase [Candidatus Acidoferrales bacterium]|nr:trehalose-phosphatase [Candidatus Acidoferrales bacterium]
MKSPAALAIEEEDSALADGQVRPRAAKNRSKQHASHPARAPRSAFRAYPAIRAQLLAADRWALFLDFDGTLVNLRPRPDDVRVQPRVKQIIQRFVGHANCFVAIVSGRRVKDLQGLIGVEGLHYIGLHGAERDDRAAPLSAIARLALGRAKRAARRDLSRLPGIWVEDKGLGFSVHHRAAGAATSQSARESLAKLLAPWGDALHVLNGSRVWEVLPSEIPGKAAAVQETLSQLPADAGVVYIGDDGTDEMAFAVLANQVTVRVGHWRGSHARYYLRSPADVLRFLARLEGELH